MMRKAKRSTRKTARPVKSLVKAVRILDALGDRPGGVGITDLSGILKAPKSTVHRLLATLEAVGYVVFDISTARYALGSRVAKLGEQVNQHSPLLNFGVAALEQLTRECREASHLAIMEGTEIVYISREESKEPVRVSFATGFRAPAHATALGKMFLAGLSDAEIHALYKGKKKLPRLTSRTKVKLEEVTAEMAAVRREGIAYDNEEYMPGLRCMAAAVRDYSTRIVAAMSLSMFKDRMTAERKRFFKESLLRASAELSEKLGYHRAPYPGYVNVVRSGLI